MANTNKSPCHRAFGGHLAMPTGLFLADMLQEPNCISGIQEKIFHEINCLQETLDNSQAAASARCVDNLCVDMRQKWSISTDTISNIGIDISQLRAL